MTDKFYFKLNKPIYVISTYVQSQSLYENSYIGYLGYNFNSGPLYDGIWYNYYDIKDAITFDSIKEAKAFYEKVKDRICVSTWYKIDLNKYDIIKIYGKVTYSHVENKNKKLKPVDKRENL